MKPKRPLAERWARNVTKGDGCWLWQGAISRGGYGVIGAGGRGGRNLLAHRVSWEIANGPILGGLFVCHHCDVRACVRPDHLFLGTAKDNDDDCRRKGRAAPIEATRHVGADNGRAKITAEQARDIREAYHALPRKQRVRRGSLTELAQRYDLTTMMVLFIANGKNWRSEGPHVAGAIRDRGADHMTIQSNGQRYRQLIRCLRLMTLLQSARFVSVPWLARALRVSTRTIRRDLAALTVAGVTHAHGGREKDMAA